MNRILKKIVEALTKRYFLNLVNRAYSQKGCEEHLTIQRWARIWYGLNQTQQYKKKLADLIISFLYQAQIELFRQGHDLLLGKSPIGFDDLHITCRSSDVNSGVVYLYGFSDNLTFFDLYRQHIEEGTTVLDVGANLGIHTAVLSRCIGEQGQVIAYEPVGRIFDRLQRTIQLNNLTNVSCRNIGIGDIPGTIGFNDKEGDFNIGKARIQTDAETSIPLTTIDKEAAGFSERVSLIKVDVEGFERQVLKGAEYTLQQHRPVVVCEFNPDNYPFWDLLDLIPFKADYYQVSYSYWEQLIPIHPDHFSETADLLIVPK